MPATTSNLKRYERVIDRYSRLVGEKSPLSEIGKATRFAEQVSGVSEIQKSILTAGSLNRSIRSASSLHRQGLIDPAWTRRIGAGLATSEAMKTLPRLGSIATPKEFEAIRSASLAGRLAETGSLTSSMRYPLGRYTARALAPPLEDLSAGIRLQRDWQRWARDLNAATWGVNTAGLNRRVMSLAASRELTRAQRQLAQAGIASSFTRVPDLRTFDPKTLETLKAVSSQLDLAKAGLNLPRIGFPTESYRAQLAKQVSATMEIAKWLDTERLLNELADLPTTPDTVAQSEELEVEPELHAEPSASPFIEDGPAWLVMRLAMVFTTAPPTVRKQFFREVVDASVTSTTSGLLIVQGNTAFAVLSLIGAWAAWDRLIEHIKSFTNQD